MRALALTLETIAGQSSTEGKVRAAAAYLASQPPARIAHAARFLAGTPLPPGTPATRVGHSTLVDLVSAFAGEDRRDLLRLATSRGDLGLAVAEVLEQHPHPPGNRLTLEEVATGLAALGQLSTSARIRRLQGLLERATPLEAKYLTKLLLGSMRTGMQSARVEEAVSLAFDQPASLVRRGHMLLGDIGVTASRAAVDSLDRVTLRAFRPVRLMLAFASEGPAEVGELLASPMIAEDKYDGIRAQLHIAGGEVRLYSRALEDFTHVFPELRRIPAGVTGEWILDGEVLAWMDGRALSFATLQQRLGRKQVPLTLLLDAPVIFLAFDVLRAASEDLIDLPLQDRKDVLERIPDGGVIRRTPYRRLDATEVVGWYEDAMRRGNEGAVFKAPDSPYSPGVRGRSWVKLKRPLGTLDVVVTGAEYGQGKRAGMLSDLIFAVRGDDGLVDAGRAYSGLTDEQIRDLTGRLRQSTLKTRGSRRRVEPRIVLEVAFDDISPSDRHPSGYALRFPRIVRLREDLTVDEISSHDELRELCEGKAP
jgi:DNA ligase-1